MPEPPSYAFEPQSPRDSGCFRMVLAGLLGVIAGVLLTITVEAAILPGLFDRVHDFFNREAAVKPPPPVPKEDPVREMEEEMKEMVRQRQEELEKDLKEQQKAIDGNK